MMNLFNDVDDFLHGNPEEKFFETVFHANRDIVSMELAKILKSFVVMELLLEGKVGDNYEKLVADLLNNFDSEKADEIEMRLKNLYIEKMGVILSQSE